jgi:hypothetical protein
MAANDEENKLPAMHPAFYGESHCAGGVSIYR